MSLLVLGVVFGGIREVLGQFSFASGWTLQAKAALRFIEDGGRVRRGNLVFGVHAPLRRKKISVSRLKCASPQQKYRTDRGLWGSLPA